MSPYQLLYRKACHLPLKLEYKYIGPLNSSIWTKRQLQKIGFYNSMNWKNSDVKPTTTPKSTRRILRSDMTRKSSGEHLNQAKKCYFTIQDSKLLEDKQPLKFGVDSLYSTIIMASSSAPVSVFYEHRFRKEFNQQLFESHARRRKVILEVGFNFDEGEYPQIIEQIFLRGWRRLAAPMTGVSKLLVQEFYANAAISDEEAANED
ncbi:hypothetical protein PIB30_044346 [Stylosanthes scabra]|uniref:Uncharacterized protein n=1 Tax=Stylosanthes scabra TaxID=79078 RepID=A0ABU6RFV7_9FABA|nr:hypothetical protein [Stylosanthes scabra]